MTSARTHPENLLSALGRCPDIYLHNLDLVNQRALLIALNEVDYRRAAFLDDRVLTPHTVGAWYPLPAVLDRLVRIPQTRSPYFIFHIGHCGSTLISRLLGELVDCFALREPLPLLCLAYSRRELNSPLSRLSAAQWERLSSAVRNLLGRSYRAMEQPIVKATSTCADLLGPLIERSPHARALLVYVDLRTYLATMLRSEAARESARANSPLWLSTLHMQTGSSALRLHELSDAQHVAVGWLGAMTYLSRVARMYPERVKIVNFDDFLHQPVATFKTMATFFGLTADDQMAQAVTGGPLMDAYAKIPEQPFNAHTRRVELNVARRRFAAEINAGADWARRLMQSRSMPDGLKQYENPETRDAPVPLDGPKDMPHYRGQHRSR